MLDFSVNSNPFGPPQSLIKALKNSSYSIGEYPDYKNKKIFAILGKFLCISPKNIGLGVGSTQILFDMPKMLPYKRAVIIIPTFWEYISFNTLFKKKIKKIRLLEKDNFAPDYNLIYKTIKVDDCVFICNTNNPTSTIYQKKKLLELIKNNPNVQFVIDETYLIFRSDYFKQSLAKQAQRQKNLHVVMSLSKFFSIPGMRLGILVSHREVVETYNKQFHIPYSVSSFSLIALLHLFKNKKFIIGAQHFYDKERERLYKLFQQKLFGRLRCVKPDGNFILARILTKQKSQNVKNSLKKNGILVRGGHELLDMTNKWVRFSIRKTKDNKKLVREMDKVLK